MDADPQETAVLKSAEEYLFRTAIIGRDMEDFAHSQVGRVLYGRAMEEIIAALEVFLQTDVQRDYQAIVDAQKRVWRAADAMGWIYKTVGEGREAETQLEETSMLDDTQPNPESYEDD